MLNALTSITACFQAPHIPQTHPVENRGLVKSCNQKQTAHSILHNLSQTFLQRGYSQRGRCKGKIGHYAKILALELLLAQGENKGRGHLLEPGGRGSSLELATLKGAAFFS